MMAPKAARSLGLSKNGLSFTYIMTRLQVNRKRGRRGKERFSAAFSIHEGQKQRPPAK